MTERAPAPAPLPHYLTTPQVPERVSDTVSVACWNVLADCYYTPPSLTPSLTHTKTSSENSTSEGVRYSVSWKKRFEQITRVIQYIARVSERVSERVTDLFLLQEVDHVEECYSPLLHSLGYEYVYVQRPGKSDGCLLAYSTTVYECVEWEEVSFNDLAQLFTTAHTHTRTHTRTHTCTSTPVREGEGYRYSSFMRHNVALLAHLRRKVSTTTCDRVSEGVSEGVSDVVVAVPHLYWNPNFEEVKNAQVTYLLDRVATFRHKVSVTHSLKESSVRVIVGGDFNSFPHSRVYEILTTPFKWECVQAKDFYELSTHSPTHSHGSSRVKLQQRYAPHRSHSVCDRVSECDSGDTVKFICDSSLSKFCRWLRVLGVNCAMYEPLSLTHAHKHQQPIDYNHLFTTARTHKRVLLTTGRKVLERSACPECFLVNPKNLEHSLVQLFSEYDIPLDVSRFLTVCGKCGGDVVSCLSDEYKRFVRMKTQVDECGSGGVVSGEQRTDECMSSTVEGDEDVVGGVWVPSGKNIFVCVECLQPYWWNESEESSPARAMQLAYRLYTLVRSSLMSEDDDAHSDAHHDTHSNALPLPVGFGRTTGGEARVLSKEELRRLFDRRDATLVALTQHERGKFLDCSSLLESKVVGVATVASADEGTVSTTSVVRDLVSTVETVERFSSGIGSDTVSGGGSGVVSGEVEDWLNLSSALAQRSEGEPVSTNWTDTFKGTLDYLLVSHPTVIRDAVVVSSIERCEALTCLTEDVLLRAEDGQCGPYPNSSWPSDHLMLYMRVKL